MAQPSRMHLAASSTRVPTINSTPNMKRSITSYSTRDDPTGTNPSTPSHTSDTHLNEQQQVKATLTNILNDDRVKHNPNGSRCVQKILLENEHDMRKHRKQSLSAYDAK
ncbi:hypothetical protein PENANT_c010G06723 [Penicillium antarcticum]|uniref:Uncharacterized protein n=1 Tax=Penicillium antarcticum TaxID=416450 RepID=A0A1V6Q7T2_9EURO|nr:uncharacterized protein N7508_000483 [Penicillium antarcticum]KAJ5320200.1 hypothetical protein N7508_000483 [Penicillium antarcticum]OQD85293.1 hypothetical protein PENANT_c010G06723 [Penicillium antarcticum]